MNQIFVAGNAVAFTGWIALLVALFLPRARRIIFLYSGLALPIAFAATYAVLLAMVMTGELPDTTGLSPLGGLLANLTDETAATMAWYHYLAFDLVVGTWIARDGLARGAWPPLLIPILALSLFYGPVGWLAYMALWVVALRKPGAPAPMPGA
ncbi:MAG: ABA4-like family protein [Maricaulaceae bacterium]|jgi:hypothetical protein